MRREAGVQLYVAAWNQIALSTGPHGTPSCPEEGHGHQIRYFPAASIYCLLLIKIIQLQVSKERRNHPFLTKESLQREPSVSEQRNMNSKCLGIKVKSSYHVSDCVSPYGMLSFLDPLGMSRMFLFSITVWVCPLGVRRVPRCLQLSPWIAVRPALAPLFGASSPSRRSLLSGREGRWHLQGSCLTRVGPESNWGSQPVLGGLGGFGTSPVFTQVLFSLEHGPPLSPSELLFFLFRTHH